MTAKQKFYVIQSGPCPECDGSGYTGCRVFCAVCDEDLTIEDINLDHDQKMHCGHFPTSIREYDIACSDCEGAGHIRREVELTQALSQSAELGTLLWDIEEWRTQYNEMHRRASAAEARVAQLERELEQLRYHPVAEAGDD